MNTRARVIVIDPSAGGTERFAAEELGRYLSRIVGKPWRVVARGCPAAGSVVLRATRRSPRPRLPAVESDETWSIDVRKDRVVLTGGSPRAVLYAVYAFLEELGCRWFAPGFEFYRGIGHEFVPRKPTLEPAPGRRVTRPSMLYREWSIEECRTQSVQNARAIIDWMAKVRANVFHAPINYQHSNRFPWNAVRNALIPEIQKRGMILKVGGHGYENFLPPEVHYDDHPEWFGQVSGKRTRDTHCVFETGNPAALRAFSRNVADYLEAHPEIDVLGLWPPDMVTWGTSKESLAQGSPARRQAIVTRAVRRELNRRKAPILLETLAYDQSEGYPENLAYPDDVMVTLSLFYQNHRGPIFEPASLPSGQTLEPLYDWTAHHRGPIVYLPYHRRYKWQSRPVVYPTVLWSDLRYLRDRGVRGMCGYAEPGDWLTYELQHYLFAKLCEDVSGDVREHVADYAQTRFSAAAEPMEKYIWLLQELSLTSQKLGYGEAFPSPGEVLRGKELYAEGERLLRSAAKTPRLPKRCSEHLARIRTGYRTVGMATELIEAQHAKDRGSLDRTIERYLRRVRRHRGKGLFVEPFWLNRGRFLFLFGGKLLGAAERRRIMEELRADV
jgi:hypothetical protein